MGSLILPSSGPVYADALIFIYSVEKHPIYALTLRPLWEAVARGDLEVLSSELTLMETLNSLAVRFTHSSSPEGRPLDSHSQPRQFLRAQRRIHPIGPIHRAFHRPS